MSLLSVYVEGAKDTSALGVRRLAGLIAARYGLAAEALEKRLIVGRFRVKANVDVATAQAFAADLEALGARCSITEADVSRPVHALKGMPALEQPTPAPALAPERAPASSRSVPAITAEVPAHAAAEDLSAGRALTPNSARTITSPAVHPSTARAATSSVGAYGAASKRSTGSSSALRPASGLSAATAGSPVREADHGLNPPTLRGAPSGLSAATVVPGVPGVPGWRGAPGAPARPVTAAMREPDASSLNPPTLRGLSDSQRPPGHVMPAMPAMPAASRTSTLPFSGLPQRAAAASTNPGDGAGGLASALADATYNNPSGLGALDGASFSLSTLDGHDDHSPRAPGDSYDEPPDYDTDVSYTPTASFDDPPAHTTPPGYDSYPQKRPSSLSRPVTAQRPPGPATGSASGAAPILRINPSVPPPMSPLAPQAPVDRFAPPEEEGPQQVHLADELRAPRRSSLAPEGAPMMAPAVAPPYVPRTGSDASTARRLKARLRIAFAAGMFAAVVLGFFPAHLVAKSRERTAFERIDNRARIAQSEITTMAEWSALDDVRTALSRQKRAAHQEIALLSILLWVGLSGALSFTWLRFGLPRFEPDYRERARDREH